MLNRGNFRSVDELQAKILEYIAFYNATAKPMNMEVQRKNKKEFNVTNVI